MKEWMCGYIGQCLSRVPRSSYRERLAAELADHLESLAEELEQSGRTPPQARTEAVERLGNPEKLALQYQSAWRRHAGAPQYWMPRLCLGCVCTGSAYFAVVAAMAALGITYDREPGIPMQGNPVLTALVGALLFLVPFFAGTMCLMRTLKGCPGQRKLVTAGLLLAWAGEKAAILALSALIYRMPLWAPGPLIGRISGGGDPTAPWFTPAYILLTLAGCVVMEAVSGGLHRSQRSCCVQ